MKTYRFIRDVLADNEKEAIEKLDEEAVLGIKNIQELFRVQENPFDDEEEGIILELAREALSDKQSYNYFGDKLDLSDKALKALLKKIKAITDR